MIVNDLQYRSRYLAPTLEQALRAFPVVVLTGARQTGKTTLAQHVADAGARPYRTLDDLRVLDLAERDPDLLLGEAEKLTLDEVQRSPSVLLAVKRAVDRDRRKGRFLLTGSANLLLMRQVSESLAGRAVYLKLGSFTEGEKRSAGRAGPWSALLGCGSAEAAFELMRNTPRQRRSWLEAAIEGGYPPVLDLAASDRPRWFEGYVTTYLERDLQQLAGITALADFRRLLRIAAERIGGILNRADLARDAALPRPTAHRYLSLLEVSYQVRLLPSYAVNRTKRLIKAPKIYWTDTGLAAHLAGVGSPGELAEDDRRGRFLENVLLAEIDAWREGLTPRPEVFYFHTTAGGEVDFVIEHRRKLLPVEVKSSSSLDARELRAITGFLDDYRAAHWGLVVYCGSEVYMPASRLLAVPIDRLPL